MSSFQKYVFQKKPKDVIVKTFNMITNKNKAKAIKKYISCYCKCKFNSTICNSNQKWNNKTCQCECKNYRTCEKNYTSVTECDEIITVMDIVSTKKAIENKCYDYPFKKFS